MVSSREIIKYIKKNLDKKDYSSMFIAGSLPQNLVPTSDLDIFFVIPSSKKDYFFDNLSSIMDNFVKIHKGIIYSFFRGPIRYKHKGLIHFLIYTEEKIPNFNNTEQFVSESRLVLRKLLKTARVIRGKSLRELTKEADLKNKVVASKNVEKMKEKYNLLQNHNKISF